MTFARNLFALSLCAAPAMAQFTINTADIPSGAPHNNSSTENVDFNDVDLDGDWDALFADGGDDGNDQNRIWINAGGLQAGAVGVFVDETAARLPSINDDSRDIELADIDADGDWDVYVSNTSAISNQTNRWWLNQGGLQAGSAGYFADDTAARWVGLGGAGSSIDTVSVLPAGGFIDWSCDCDFGDLDDDGDMDLVHSSYGGVFGGNVPTRIFLNDGAGFFSEFNPSGYQLAGVSIANGNPALWCEGTQQANTTNTVGGQADIASSALDIDLGDLDGDFDLDILHGARQEPPRIFANRLAEQGTLGFRDVSAAALPSGYSTGNGHYEQELGDLDSDGDLDIYGLNWLVGFGFNDVTLENDGSGSFSNLTTLANSTSDDNEGDFLDYDGDGDLDLYVANFSGQDRLYQNNEDGSGTYSFTQASLPSFSVVSLDAEAADLDADGDPDIMVTADNFTANVYLENTSGIPDVHPPAIPSVEVLASSAAGPGTRSVRAAVLDNDPYYVVWFVDVAFEVEVDGVRLPDAGALPMGGQIFRGVLPANLVGSVEYRVRATDAQGNSTTSSALSYTASGGPVGTGFGAGTSASSGVPTLTALSVPLPGSTLYLNAAGWTPGTAVFHIVGTQAQVPAVDLSNGFLLNVALPILGLFPALADASGDAVFSVGVPPGLAGVTLHAQALGADGTAGMTFATTAGLSLSL